MLELNVSLNFFLMVEMPKYTLIIMVLSMMTIFGQEQFVPADIEVVGDRSWRRAGILNGNLITVSYFNTSHVDGLFWPTGSRHTYMDDLVPFVSAEAIDVKGNLIHPLESNYNFNLDISPDGLNEWGWQPLPGYLNPNQHNPAISNKTNTWPDVWPDRPEWAGFWNGFFGRGILNAQQETYFVVDDDADEEFEYYPDSTDQNRRGLGLRMSVRGMQWSNVLAEDCIFWIYDVSNVSTTDYEKTLFGMFVDSKNGGHDFDNGFYDTFIDITYIWDQTGVGTWNGPTGWIGYGYLESPGIGDDGIDNDEDGLLDENRDSGPGEYLFGPVGIYGPPKMHWSGDEDGDWNPDTDDVGKDGVGPLNENYFGPDEGEGDGIPTEGEPNFDRTDLDESDQIGLQSVSLHSWGDFPLHEDDLIWGFLANHNFDPVQNFSNIGILYSSGPFPLATKRSERFSLAQLMGADFDDLVRNKDIVQRIFNANYRFARPPDKPTVKAVAGEGFVTLSWNNKAEFSRDPFLGLDPDSLGFKVDFEGYAIYRSTDPGLLDSRLVTDGFGNIIFRKPEAQFDNLNGVYGTSPIGLPNGAHFYLGDDVGLAHTWTDTNVVNGKTYYYAVVSYDAGDPNIGSEGLPPSESASIIEQDVLGVITTDINTVQITPGVPAAGYQSPEVQTRPEHLSGNASGYTEVEVVFPEEFRSNQQYKISFHDSVLVENKYYHILTSDYSVNNESSSEKVIDRSPFVSGGDMFPIFEGLGIKIFNHDIAVLAEESGLVSGISDYTLDIYPDTVTGFGGFYPADFEIRFASSIVDTSSGSEIGLPEIPVNFTVFNLTEEKSAEFLFYDNDNDQQVTDKDEIVPLVPDDFYPSFTGYRATWRIRFIAGSTPPQPNDAFKLLVTKPFGSNDEFVFETFQSAKVDPQMAKSDLNRIKVVPNPYIATNDLEPRNNLTSGRGQRVIQFTHLPQQCTIRIFNLRGQLVDLIEHKSTIDDGVASWDLVSQAGIDVSFGVYIYHVESEVGNKIGRFALIK
jgi:hypothetical protein